jgi:uncharacterized protein YdiU (UPF0061 family)
MTEPIGEPTSNDPEPALNKTRDNVEIKKITNEEASAENPKQPAPSPEEQTQNLEKEIQIKKQEAERLTGTIIITKAEIENMREKLGLPPTKEEPPNILSDKKRIEVLQKEQADLEKQKEGLSGQQKGKINPENKITEKERREFAEEISVSFERLSDEVQSLEDTLRSNKFNRLSFNADDFRAIVTDGSIDFKKALLALDGLQINLKKDFTPKDQRDRASIEPHNFRRVMDALDKITGAIITLQNKVNERPAIENETQAKELSKSLSKTKNVARKKTDDIEEFRTVLRRFLNR